MLFANFIAAVNYALHHRKITFNYPNSCNSFFIVLNLLISEGLISSYSTYVITPFDIKRTSFTKQKKRRFGVSMFFHYKKGRYNILHNAKTVSTPGWFKFISYYKLRSLIFKLPSSVFLLSISGLGYVASVVASKARAGGKLVLKLN